MQNRTTILILAVVSLACLTTSAARAQAPGMPSNRIPLDLFSEQTSAFFSVDILSVLRSDWVKQARKAQTWNPEDQLQLERVRQATGIDPEKDLHRIFLGFEQSMSYGAEPSVVITGSLNRKKAGGAARSLPSVISESYKGYEILGFQDEGTQRPFFLCFLSDSQAALGTRSSVQGMIDRRKGGGSSLAKNQEVLKLVNQVDQGGTAWGVLLIPAPIRQQIETIPMAQSFKGLQASTLDLKLSSRLELAMRGHCIDGPSAQMLYNAVNGLLALGKMNLAESNPELYGLLNEFHLTKESESVRLDLTLTREMLEKLQSITVDPQTLAGIAGIPVQGGS